MRFFLLLLTALLILAPCARADNGTDFYIYPDDIYHGNPDPRTGLTYQPPSEPGIPQVKFLKAAPPSGAQEQVDRLLQGIKVDIPPEYDVYGYELRRYMAHVGAPEIYSDTKRLKDELSNIKTAEIIYRYWMVDIHRQVKDIQSVLDDPNTSADLRSTYNYNSGVVMAFNSECKAWLENNEAVLQFLVDHPDAYTFQNSVLQFNDVDLRAQFKSLFLAREEARKTINQYPPFAGMIY